MEQANALSFSTAPTCLDQTMFSHLNDFLDCWHCSERKREREEDAELGESRKNEGAVPERSCESNYVLWNVIICDE